MNDLLINPPREFSLLPFWFWNDELDEKELVRQIDDFCNHGVYGFVIHPRVGLPRSIGWMSDRLLHFMKVAIDYAAKQDLKVILYDEGMYPSGSSCGQVVQHDPNLAARCLAYVKLEAGQPLALPAGHNLIAQLNTSSNGLIAVVDRPVNAYIRGLHYIDEGPKEDEPPAGDILNPKTTQLILHLVHEIFYARFKEHFGKTIIGVFTDEPNALGKCREKIARPGTAGILSHIQKILGYDFMPHLPALWFDDEPDAKLHRANYLRAVRKRMNETWYRPLSEWCQSHGVALCGHPADGDEIGTERFFHIPGQDLVWRFIEPNKPSATQGHESTQAKVASSAMIHLGRRRNSNEFCGAYGHETTFEEFKWLADWCLVRGQNLLIPHAFYYSVRGPRRDERPPQVGPNSKWWDRFKPFADHCRRLSWLNTDSQHVCNIAILCDPDHAPWPAAEVLFKNQIDFNYLDWTTLLADASIDSTGISIQSMRYDALIIDNQRPPAEVAAMIEGMKKSGRVFHFDSNLIPSLDKLTRRDITAKTPSPGLRFRHVVKNDRHYYMFVNEISSPIDTEISLSAPGKPSWVNTETGQRTSINGPVHLRLAGFGVALIEM